MKGIPHNAFLLASAFTPDNYADVDEMDREVILLRVMGTCKLPQDDDVIKTKLDSYQNLTELGFAAFYLNRTNHSGILSNAGPIGGFDQTGNYLIDARFNRPELVRRVCDIATYSLANNGKKSELMFLCDDALWPSKAELKEKRIAINLRGEDDGE